MSHISASKTLFLFMSTERYFTSLLSRQRILDYTSIAFYADKNYTLLNSSFKENKR